MQQYRKPMVVATLCLLFTTLFLFNTKRDFPLIFKKDLLAHDESSNSVVAANITRKFFPPMVRTNPLVEQQGNWMEGPYWQHIPPLFAYVPYVFFKLDGQITIEVKRLSFAFITLLTGLLFILGTYKFKKNIFVSGAATLAAVLWVSTPFTHELITGYAFGVSDIVLAFTIVASFIALLWYLQEEKSKRINYPIWKFILIGLVVATPIMAKNLLGAIPAATFFILLLLDFRSLNKKVLAAIGGFVAILIAYYMPLYLASSETFKNEILVSFLHFKKLEGWDRPWNYYITNYLPQRYLHRWAWLYFTALVGSLAYILLQYKKIDRIDRIILVLSGGWFVWNLFVITLVTSKVPNFIYQSYLLSLFFIIYCLFAFARSVATKQSALSGLVRFARRFEILIIPILFVSIVTTGYEIVRFTLQFPVQRTQAYNYSTEREKFYGTAEALQGMGVNSKDLTIIRVSDNDCWFRYPILFLTGAEAKTLLELSFGYDAQQIKDKYNRLYLIINADEPEPDLDYTQRFDLPDYSIIFYDLHNMNSEEIRHVVDDFIIQHQQDIAQDIVRIKKDKTSCQWLVPDPILNAP